MATLTRNPESSDLASIDAELDLDHLAALESVLRQPSRPPAAAFQPQEDQASRLRALVRPSETTEPTARPLGHTPRWPTTKPSPSAPRTAKVITIASGKGGVGKTNISVNLAIALARHGLRVTLLDADLGTANADVLCGLLPAARLDHILAPGGLAWQDGGRRTIRDIAIEAPGGFRLVPGAAGISRLADLTSSEQRVLVRALHELERDADILIVDAAAGIGRAVTAFMHAADLGLIVTTPEPTALADAYALTKCALLGESGGMALADDDRLALIVNQVRDPLEAFAVHNRFTKVCERFLGASIPVLGFVAQDLRVSQAVRAQKPLLLSAPDSPAALNICDLADAAINRLGVRAANAHTESPAASSRGVSGLVRRLLGF